jgi:OCT family organic cation transporter-like MFS transporter 4/5
MLSTIGKFGISAGFALIYLYTAELSPTVVRSVHIGVGSVSARIFTMLAPYIADLVSIEIADIFSVIFL